MNPSDADELRALAEAYVAGELSAGQKVELENRLRTGEEARLCFLAFLEVHAGLAWEFRGGNAALREHPEAREMFRRACHVDAGLLTMAAKDAPVRRFWSDRWMPLAAAAAIVMVLGLSALWLMSSWGTVARVARAESTADMKPGDRLAIGRRIELSGGKVVIEFNCGAVATLTGPCVFEIESATQALLQRGHVHTLAARPEAKGFTIRTPRSRVVDLGTEFVTTVADDGHSRVDVNSGEVVVHLSGSDASHHLRQGEMLAVEPGDRQVTVRIERGDGTPAFRFPTIPPPSNTDYADASRGLARVSLVGGPLRALRFNPAFVSGGMDRLVDGRAQGSADSPLESVFFEDGALGGFLFDLGKPVAISKINSYSWHVSVFRNENHVRATQKYTLWGFAGDEPPDAERPSAAKGWERIARVNTDEFFEVSAPTMRPAQQGTSVSAQHGNLGRFRFLLFEVYPTRAAHDNDLDHTFYGEIDVYAEP